MRGIGGRRVGSLQFGRLFRGELPFAKFSRGGTAGRSLCRPGPAALSRLLIEHDVRILRVGVRESFSSGAASAAGEEKRRKQDRYFPWIFHRGRTS